MKRKRIVLFSHDGSGLGHLRRICRIAQALQKEFDTLIVTGMRRALWLIPDSCEFCYLPSWDSLRENRAAYWKKHPWLDIDLTGAIELRSRLLNNIIESFTPNAIIVDYLPLGLHDELSELFARSTAMKYLVLRGVIDSSDGAVFFDNASEAIATLYDRIFVAADRQVIDVTREYSFSQTFIEKIQYVGYVTSKSIGSEELRTRAEIGSKYSKWVVCSAGGGKYANSMISECLKMGKLFPACKFDIVCGPLSNFEMDHLEPLTENCEIHKYLDGLDTFHASCDILVTSGGYNSILEAGFGGANIIVFPNQTGLDDEQRINANRLSSYFNITLLETIEQLHSAILKNIRRNKNQSSGLCRSGDENILIALKQDLGIKEL